MGNTTHNSLQITPAAGEVIDQLANSTLLPKKVIVERVFKWLESQDEILRAIILKQVPPSLQQDAAKIALERIAKSERQKKTA